MNWLVLGTWAAPKKVRDENVDDDIALVIAEALTALENASELRPPTPVTRHPQERG
jgi:hypothetical protein